VGLTGVPETSASAAFDPPSPCVQLCVLDVHGVCAGCGRSVEEIALWSTASAETRLAILARAKCRQSDRTSTDAKRRR